LGPMIDDVNTRDRCSAVMTTAYWVDATIGAFTRVARALTREAPSGRRTVR